MIYALFIATAVTTFVAMVALATWEVIADRWAAYQDGARRALEQPDPFTFTPDQQAAYDAHVRQALQAVASAPVVPMQREAGRWS